MTAIAPALTSNWHGVKWGGIGFGRNANTRHFRAKPQAINRIDFDTASIFGSSSAFFGYEERRGTSLFVEKVEGDNLTGHILATDDSARVETSNKAPICNAQYWR